MTALLIAGAAAFATGTSIEHATAGSDSRPVHLEQGPQAGLAGENPADAEGAARGGSAAAHAAGHSSKDLARDQPGGDRAGGDRVAVPVLLAALIRTMSWPPPAAGAARGNARARRMGHR
jgi:hypothetical protein